MNSLRGRGEGTKQLQGTLANPLGVVVSSSFSNAAESGGGLASTSSVTVEVANGGAQQCGPGAADSGKEGVLAMNNNVPNRLLVWLKEVLDQLCVESFVTEVGVLENGLGWDENEAVSVLATSEDDQAGSRDVSLGVR